MVRQPLRWSLSFTTFASVEWLRMSFQSPTVCQVLTDCTRSYGRRFYHYRIHPEHVYDLFAVPREKWLLFWGGLRGILVQSSFCLTKIIHPSKAVQRARYSEFIISEVG